MHQNQASKQIYKELLESNPTKRIKEEITMQAQSLTLHWPNGEKETFYYPFLIRVGFKQPNETNALILYFTSFKIILQGYRLEQLHARFSEQKPSDIYINEQRYSLIDNISPLITDAQIEERK